MTEYSHNVDGVPATLAVGKVVCVGRNFADHAKELNNAIPTEPVLFIKPSTALVNLEMPIAIPLNFGSCHFETEMAVLIGDKLTCCDERQAAGAIAGVGVALDLTLRDLQSELKDKRLPWEKAKGFDGACPMSAFVSPQNIGDIQNQQIRLSQNGGATTEWQ